MRLTLLLWLLTFGTAFSARTYAQTTDVAPPPTAEPPAVRAVPTPSEVAAQALRDLEQREHALRATPNPHCARCGTTALWIGVPVATTFISWGAVLMRLSNTEHAEDPDWAETDRRAAWTLLGVGMAGAISALYGTVKLIQGRHVTRETECELRSIRDRRSLLERVFAQPEARNAQPVIPIAAP